MTIERRAFSVAVFCRHGGEILLVRHRRLGTWLPVGGEIERGETPLGAARRELREETGLEGRFPAGLGVDGTPPGLIGYEEHQAGSKGLHMNFAFVADVATRELAACDEWTEARWVGSADGIECPRNVRELVAIALATPLAEEAELG
ncbi:MAG TPA: NUDIX domain-containing protein [Anaeromyxobacteraceae bacterium]